MSYRSDQGEPSRPEPGGSEPQWGQFGPSPPPPSGAGTAYGAPPPGWGAPSEAYGSSGYGAPPPYPPQGYGGPPPYGYGPGYYGPPRSEGTAIGALVSAIASWVVCPVIPAIAALVLASGASRKIRESGGQLTGDGMVTAARVISWANIVACVVVLVLFVGAFFAALVGSS